MPQRREGLARFLSYVDNPSSAANPPGADPSYADEEFWAAFEVDDDYEPRVPWYRKTARTMAALFVAALIASGALLAWGEFFERIDNVKDPEEILAIANETVDESPYGWLVTEVRVRDIPDYNVGGFVVSNPPDGIITIDLQSWDPEELRSTTIHEIGHLLDFAAYGSLLDRRDGLGSEAWAECAAVDAGFRRTDSGIGDSAYHCTAEELDQYRFSVSLLGEVCKTWGDRSCQSVAPIESNEQGAE